MSAADVVAQPPGGEGIRSGGAAAPAVGRWLTLAAAPTFAMMALWTDLFSHPDMLCAATRGSSGMSGMTLMYLLMSVFHAPGWLKLIAGRGKPRGSAFAAGRK
jgi:hypothetical protein